jgi:hypothetical protein
MKQFTTAIVALLFVTVARSQDVDLSKWCKVYTSADKSTVYYVNKDITAKSYYHTCWIRTEYKTFKNEGKVYYNAYSVNLWGFNFTEKETKLLHLNAYTKDGKLIYSYDVDAIRSWTPNVPETISELVFKIVEFGYNNPDEFAKLFFHE